MGNTSIWERTSVVRHERRLEYFTYLSAILLIGLLINACWGYGEPIRSLLWSWFPS